MSRYCRHNMVWGRCPECEMGYVPPKPPIRLNLDRFGLPRDYATYEWVMYRSVVQDDSPARAAFLCTRIPGAPSRPSVTRAVRA